MEDIYAAHPEGTHLIRDSGRMGGGLEEWGGILGVRKSRREKKTVGELKRSALLYGCNTNQRVVRRLFDGLAADRSGKRGEDGLLSGRGWMRSVIFHTREFPGGKGKS